MISDASDILIDIGAKPLIIQQQNSNRNTFVDIRKHMDALLHPVSGHQRRCMAHQAGY